MCWATSTVATSQVSCLICSNIPDAFRSLCRPALGRSDHNVIHLVPKYRQLVKCEKPRTHSVQVWDHDNSETLRWCFDCTDWQVFLDGCFDNVDDIADTVTSYIQFCEQMVIQTKTVRMFPNNKPRFTKELKGILNEKKHAFRNGDCTLLRGLNKEFGSKLKLAKPQYKDKS